MKCRTRLWDDFAWDEDSLLDLHVFLKHQCRFMMILDESVDNVEIDNELHPGNCFEWSFLFPLNIHSLSCAFFDFSRQ